MAQKRGHVQPRAQNLSVTRLNRPNPPPPPRHPAVSAGVQLFQLTVLRLATFTNNTLPEIIHEVYLYSFTIDGILKLQVQIK